MKLFLKLLTLIGLVGITGCRNLGYNDQSLNNGMTPGTSQETYVRTYDQNGNPIVTPTSPAKSSDPASSGNQK